MDKSVLFVDKDTDLLKLYKKLFQKSYTVLTASTAEEALHLLKTIKFDAVVVDLELCESLVDKHHELIVTSLFEYDHDTVIDKLKVRDYLTMILD